MSILKNSFTVSIWTFGSRIFGFVRDMVIANKLGAGVASDAFFIALVLPNMLRRLFAEGAFNFAFVPMVTRRNEEGREIAEKFASQAFSGLLLVSLAIVTLAEIFMPQVVTAVAPGYASSPEKFELTVFFARITFPYMLLIIMASMLGCVCNMLGKFALYAGMPALLNVSFLTCILTMPDIWGISPALAASIAVPIGGVMQLALMVYGVRKTGFRIYISSPFKSPDIKKLLYRMGPAALGVGVLQISFLIDTFLASFLEGPAITYLNMANRFYQLPLALIGLAMATVLLPHFSRILKKQDKEDLSAVSEAFSTAWTGGIILAMAATVGLMVLSEELMALVLGHGKYSEQDAQLTAWAMMAYSAGLVGYISTKITATVFYAKEDTKTPMLASAASLVVNFIFNMILMRYFGHVGIAASTAIAGIFNACLQLYLLRRAGLGVSGVSSMIVKGALTCMAMATLLIGFEYIVPYGESIFMRVIWLISSVGLGAVLFAICVHLTGVFDVKAVVSKITKRA